MGGDDVGVVQPLDVDVLVGLDVGQGPDPVAIDGGGLEIQARGGRFHGLGEGALHARRASGQEVARLLDKGGVVAGRDPPDAGRRAALDLIHEAGARPAGEDGIGAGAQEEGFFQRRDGAVDRAGRGEGPEVGAVALLRAAVLGDLRIVVVVGDQDVGKGLVVAQQHIVARHEALDQVALEQQRLDLAVGRHHLELVGFRDHALEAIGQSCDLGVGGHPLLEALRLADVEGVAATVQHAVDPWRIRQGPDRAGDLLHAAAERQRLGGVFLRRRGLRTHGGPLASGRGVLGAPSSLRCHHGVTHHPRRPGHKALRSLNRDSPAPR